MNNMEQVLNNANQMTQLAPRQNDPNTELRMEETAKTCIHLVSEIEKTI